MPLHRETLPKWILPPPKWILPQHDMNKTAAILELECRVANARGSLTFELFEYLRDVALIFGCAFRFDFISHHCPFHRCLLFLG
jgi:hypothetical protein